MMLRANWRRGLHAGLNGKLSTRAFKLMFVNNKKLDPAHGLR
jgi:hypothetical protein